MEKMMITEYGRPVPMNKVKEFVRRAIPLDDEKVIPYALFALLDNAERLFLVFLQRIKSLYLM